jgi:DNA helicase-2/ATP-dependent DNA helicase PcrA
MVFQRKAILAITKAQPSTRDQLLLIPGLGPAKVERFGDDILALVEQFS